MNCYEHNIQCLKQYRSNIYEEINKSDPLAFTNQLEEVRTETSIYGEKLLVIRKDGKEYRMNSSYSPSNEAMIWAEQYQFKNINNVITMFGLGNGIFAKELLKKCNKEDFLFIYEPCLDIFLHVLKEYDLTDLLSNRYVILTIEGVNDFDFHNLLLNIVNITNMSSQTQCAHPYYNDLFEESCLKYWKELKDNIVHTKININTQIIFGERLIINSINNIKHIINSNILFDFAKDIQLDVPAIIVSAGPSLKRNIEELKRAKGKAYIFVVDRILDYVLDNGLKPDFVVTIDPTKPLKYFTNREDVTIPLLCELVSNSDVLDRHKGRKIFYSCSTYFKKMYESVDKMAPSLVSGSSVATAAFAVCVRLGFQKIVLVGQDLAYDGEFTHAGGVAEKFEGNSDIMVEGIDGSPVRSRYDWYEFLIWFKDMITLHPEIQVIDTKDKGAKIQGSTLIPLNEVIDNFCNKEINFEQVVSSKEVSFTETELDKVKKFFDDSYEELAILKKKSKEALTICERQIKYYKRNQDDTDATIKNFKKISKINKYINDRPTYFLLDSYITSLTANYINKLYKFTDDLKMDKIETYEKSKKIYEAVIAGVEFTMPRLKTALEQFDMQQQIAR